MYRIFAFKQVSLVEANRGRSWSFGPGLDILRDWDIQLGSWLFTSQSVLCSCSQSLRELMRSLGMEGLGSRVGLVACGYDQCSEWSSRPAGDLPAGQLVKVQFINS